MKLQIISALNRELKKAIKKEKQSLKEFDECETDRSELLVNCHRDSGYTNGLLEALDIVRRVK